MKFLYNLYDVYHIKSMLILFVLFNLLLKRSPRKNGDIPFGQDEDLPMEYAGIGLLSIGLLRVSD